MQGFGEFEGGIGGVVGINGVGGGGEVGFKIKAIEVMDDLLEGCLDVLHIIYYIMVYRDIGYESKVIFPSYRFITALYKHPHK